MDTHNFKFIKRSKAKPTHLVAYQPFDGYEAYYQPKKNRHLFTIYDPVKELYHTFEHNGISTRFRDIVKDLMYIVRNVIRQPERYR